jgi:hypothetical protein
MDPDKNRFVELLSFVLDGICSDSEWEEFILLQQEHPEWTVELVDEIFTHNLLHWQSQDLSDFVALELAASIGEGTQKAAPQRPVRASTLRWWGAIAAMLLIAAGIVTWQVFRSSSTPNLAIAEIIAQSGVAWNEQSTAIVNGTSIVPGRLQTDAGTFTMQFRTGPTVKIAGPASLRIESDMLLNLDRGQATTRVPDSVIGFSIKTPVVKVVDQGTEFGVAARDDGKTDVIVFDGKVDMQETAGAMMEPKRLIRGEAARVDDQGAFGRISQIGRDSSGEWWTADQPNSNESVIKLVRDIYFAPTDDPNYFCYQIMFHGLEDDVFAYADHPHQWNGLTSAGLPDFLRGADYVKTFNDYRYLQEFKMAVDLSQPANLYVFADDRIAPPQWLTDQFQDTGVDIGLDEGPWEGILDHNNEVAGGRSIDTIFSVWHRKCLDTSSVMLGDAGEWGSEGKQGRAMYGVAATPLDAKQPPSRQLPSDNHDSR